MDEIIYLADGITILGSDTKHSEKPEPEIPDHDIPDADEIVNYYFSKKVQKEFQ